MNVKIFIRSTALLLLLLASFTIFANGYYNFPQDTIKKSTATGKPVSTAKEKPATQGTPSKSKQSMIIRPGNKDTLNKNQNPLQVKGPTDPNKLKAQEYFKTGSRKENEGDYQGALDDYSKSISLFKNGNTYLKRALTYISMDNYPLALEDLNEAIKLLPNSAKAYITRGVCLYEMKDFKKAEEDLTRTIELDSTNKGAYNYKAAIKFQENDFKGALENYDNVIRLDSNYKEAYTNRGMIRHYLQDYKGAVADYDKALKLDPYNPTAYNNRGAAKMTLQDYKSAIADFDAALQLKDDYADAYGNRGDAKLKTGDTNGACEDWQKAYSLGLEKSMEVIMKYCK
jgi:tetratricopeptide (TPR) repeat protein